MSYDELADYLESWGHTWPDDTDSHKDRMRAADAIRTLLRERDEARALLHDWSDLIQYQYTGTREGMSDMTRCAQATARFLKIGAWADDALAGGKHE